MHKNHDNLFVTKHRQYLDE